MIPVHDINDMLPAEIEEMEAVMTEFYANSVMNDIERVTAFFDAVQEKREIVGVDVDGEHRIGDEDFLIKTILHAPDCRIHIFDEKGKMLHVTVRNRFVCGWSANHDWLREICIQYMATLS